MFALSIGLALVASVWVDDIVRTDLLNQREKQLSSTADQIAAELNLKLALRQQSVRTLAALLSTELRDENQATIRRILDKLKQVSPEFEWISVVSPQGRVMAATTSELEGINIANQSWFSVGLKGAKSGDVRLASWAATTPHGASNSWPGSDIVLIADVIDVNGETLGVVATQLSSRWWQDLRPAHGSASRGSTSAQALVLDRQGTVLIGPADYQGKRWESSPDSTDTEANRATVNVSVGAAEPVPRVRQLADGEFYLVAQSTPGSFDTLQTVGWRVVVIQSLKDATLRATTLQGQITATLLGLGLFVAMLGVVLARRVTRDLGAIARSADAVRAGTTQRIALPRGRNEAARLGHALDELLFSLHHERSALQTLNAELDQRVAARTREIERLADQARYAAVVRERLKIARDLHDTLAHSMMAMLTEIRFLKRLSTTRPEALAEELTRAEETAHQGLKEARAAITQMRFNPVRDAGLAVALDDLVRLFVERTGIRVDYTSDAPAGAFADEQAETLFRIVEEVMRNVERHARASRVVISLRVPTGGYHGLTLTIADDGIGFEPQAAHPGHYGISGLREQARLIEAVLTINSRLRQGTTVELYFG
jgi:signal transduction histidine kinase